MTDERIIKKYPNRRLYDTERSKYITISDVRSMVLSGLRFKVVDSNTKENITRQILMQIIIEEEAAGKPLFSVDMLSQLIRFYGGAMQGMFTQYLEESFKIFSHQQQEPTGSIPDNPIEALSTLTQKNLDMWSDMQKGFLKSAGLNPDDKSEKDE
jgi:polyhydroxyalkanoate synthesis repressor PhaR